MCKLCDLKQVFDKDLTDEERKKAIEEELCKAEIVMTLDSNPDIGIPMEELGLTYEDFQNAESYEIEEDDYEIGRENFEKKSQFKIVNLYLYDSNAYGSRGYGSNSREFCIKLATRTRSSVMRYQDILRLTPNPGLGQGGSNIYSVFRYRGGKNCKHFWTKYYYDTESQKLVKAPNSLQPKQVDKGSVGGAPE